MAQRKKRARKTTTHRKARKALKSARGKAVKRGVAKPASRKHLGRAKPKRARVKKIVRKRAKPVKPPSTRAVETVVDVIEEAVPGVITVTEFEETEVREPSKGPNEAEENGSLPPEPEVQ
jgi:hypothetical protein